LSRFRGMRVTYKTGSGLDDWIYWHPIHSARDYKQYSAIADLHTLQFTVAHALGFSVFTSRILAVDFITVSLSLQIAREVFFAPSNSFLATLAAANSEDSTQFNYSAPKLISRQAGISNLDPSLAIPLQCFIYNRFARTTQKTRSLYCWECVFRAPLHSNRSYSIVACIFDATRMCLPSRCLANNVYSDSDSFLRVPRVEAGSNTSTVALRVVGGDEKGSLESEAVNPTGFEPENYCAGEGQHQL
jgi:hypothetical protein